MIPRTFFTVLVALAILLPIVTVVLAATAPLLTAMDDTTGASVVGGVSRALVVLWGVNLVVLLLALAIRSLEREPPRDD